MWRRRWCRARGVDSQDGRTFEFFSARFWPTLVIWTFCEALGHGEGARPKRQGRRSAHLGLVDDWGSRDLGTVVLGFTLRRELRHHGEWRGSFDRRSPRSVSACRLGERSGSEADRLPPGWQPKGGECSDRQRPVCGDSRRGTDAAWSARPYGFACSPRWEGSYSLDIPTSCPEASSKESPSPWRLRVGQP